MHHPHPSSNAAHPPTGLQRKPHSKITTSSGAVQIASAGHFDNSYRISGTTDARTCAVSYTGTYDIVTLHNAGHCVGIEIVFDMPEALDAAIDAARANGARELTDAECEALYHHTDGHAAAAEAEHAWATALGAALATTWPDHLRTADPAHTADATTTGTITHPGGPVEIGDPFIGTPDTHVEIPAGTYTALLWYHQPARTPARAGLYRTADH